MSYVITSNVESEDVLLIGGYSDPATYLNNFRSPLLLDIDSEVAVESVKIDRQDEWDIKDSDVFFFYFGEEQSPTITSGKVSKNGVRVNMRPGSYNVKGMALEITRALNNSAVGPALFGTCLVSALSDTTTFKFRGFEFKFSPRARGADRVPSWIPTTFKSNNYLTIGYDRDPDNAVSAGVWDIGTKELECNVGIDPLSTNNDIEYFTKPNGFVLRSNCSYRVEDYPLSNAKGRAVFGLNGANQLDSPFQVGLVKPTNPYVRNGRDFLLTSMGNPNENTNASTHMDYFAVWENATIAPLPVFAGALKIYTFGNVNSDNPSWKQKEVQYYNVNNPVATQFDANAPLGEAELNAKFITEIIFELDGDELRVILRDEGDDTIDPARPATEYPLIAVSLSTDDRRWNFPPVGNANEALVPAIALTENEQKCGLKTYNANVLPGWRYSTPSNTDINIDTGDWRAYTPLNTALLVSGSDWYSQAVNSENANNELSYNQARPSFLMKNAQTTGFVFRYVNINASNVVDYKPVLILGEENRPRNADGSFANSDYDDELYVIPIPENQANMSKNLGFGKWSVIEYTGDAGGGAKDDDSFKTLTSFEAGQYTIHSAFVRINDLPIQSFNGATSSRSNILYHIPRFTNDGKQYGELYFNAPEKTYIKLNNTQPLMLNQLKVDIVSRAERIVQDLTGSTIVVLHFRKSKQ
jgi:hypothetical protein